MKLPKSIKHTKVFGQPRGWYQRRGAKTRFYYHRSATWVQVFMSDSWWSIHRMTFGSEGEAKEVALSRCVRGFRPDLNTLKVRIFRRQILMEDVND